MTTPTIPSSGAPAAGARVILFSDLLPSEPPALGPYVLAGVVVGAVTVELAQGRVSRAEARLLPLGRIVDTTPPTAAEIERMAP